MSVHNYADSSIFTYNLLVQPSALEKYLALFCLVIRFCTKVMEVTAELWPALEDAVSGSKRPGMVMIEVALRKQLRATARGEF